MGDITKSIEYRCYKSFDEKTFLLELESKNLIRNSISSNENYEYLSYQFADVVNKHVFLNQNLTRQYVMHLPLTNISERRCELNKCSKKQV